MISELSGSGEILRQCNDREGHEFTRAAESDHQMRLSAAEVSFFRKPPSKWPSYGTAKAMPFPYGTLVASTFALSNSPPLIPFSHA